MLSGFVRFGKCLHRKLVCFFTLKKYALPFPRVCHDANICNSRWLGGDLITAIKNLQINHSDVCNVCLRVCLCSFAGRGKGQRMPESSEASVHSNLI